MQLTWGQHLHLSSEGSNLELLGLRYKNCCKINKPMPSAQRGTPTHSQMMSVLCWFSTFVILKMSTMFISRFKSLLLFLQINGSSCTETGRKRLHCRGGKIQEKNKQNSIIIHSGEIGFLVCGSQAVLSPLQHVQQLCDRNCHAPPIK